MPPPASDFLGGQPAFPNTLVPGRWLVDLPSSSSTIFIRRYRPLAHDQVAEALADGLKRGNGDALLGRLGQEALEEGWRAVNGSGPSSTGDVDKVLRGGCGVIVRAEPESEGDGESKSQGKRELWCFYATESEAMMPRDALQGRVIADPQVLSISMSRYISCTQHGHDLACLTRSNGGADGCDVIFSTSSDTARHWEYLTAAVVEKLAWRMGRRLWMLPRPSSSSSSPFNASLRPISATRLLLSLSPRRRVRCQSEPEGHQSSRQPEPVMLQHLDLPAIRLSALHPTAAQQSRLTTLFDTVLSPSWKASRPERRLAAHLAGQQWTDWSIYWVPTPSPQDAADITQLLPQQVMSHWQQRSGILTVWPTSLTSELSPPRPTALKRKHEAAPDFTVPPITDLLYTAFGLFESLTAAKPPEPEEPVKEESEMADEGRPIELTPEPLFDEDGVGSPKSDLDDLFSDNGDASPPTDENGDASGGSPVGGETETGQAQDDLFGGDESAAVIEGDVPMEDDVPVAYEAQERGMDDRPDDTMMITEDDFAFFDTPAVSPEASAAIEQVMETRPPPPVELPTVHEVAEEAIEETKPPEAPVNGGAADVVEQPSEQPPEPETNIVAGEDAAAPPPLRATPSTSPQVRFAELPPESARSPSPQPPSPEQQIIPCEFEPVALPSNTLPSLNYAFPSPAPTPESLRSDLVERLQKQPAKKAKYDYAADWATQDEPSEIDEDESYTGAPPTPESDDDMELSRESTPEAKQDLVRDGDEVEFGGIRCIGAEWAWIKDEPEMLNALARQWNQGWIAAGKANPTGALPPSPAPSPPDGNAECLANMDIDRLAGELISNRHFRQLLLPETFTADALDESDPLTKTGTPLSQLMPPSDDSSQIDDDIALAFLDTSDAIVEAVAVAEPKPLAMVNIHAGFAGYVTRLSIASLSYWRQLGLVPVGGKKDVSAVMICDAGEDSKRAAERLMTKLGATYETLGLGSHRPLETAKTPDGIAAVQASAFVETLDEVLRGYSDSSDHLIVYVFFNNMAAATSPAALQLLFSSRPTPPTCSIHILTPTAIQMRHLQPIVREVYNRISRQIRRIEEYGHTLDEPPVWMRYPSFTLAPDQPPKMQLTLTWPLRSYDLLNKWRLVHGAYAYDKDLEIVIAFVIDSEGESHEVRTWRTKDMGMRERLQRLWDFFRVFADKAAIEWRMSICRLGAMSSDEAEVWGDIPRPRTAALSLLMVLDPPSPGPAISRPRPAVPNITAAMLNDTSTRIIDESLTAYLTTSTQRLPVDLPDSSGTSSTSTQSVYPKSSFVLSVATPGAVGGENISAAYQILSHVAAPGKEKESVGEILGREFYRLLCLGRVRYGFEGSGMPVHLEAVRAVLEGMRTMSNGTR